MDLCDQPHIFKKFYQGNSKFFSPHEGTGLGLSIVQSLTRILGGKVSFKSHIGAGIEFSVTEVCKSVKRSVDELFLIQKQSRYFKDQFVGLEHNKVVAFISVLTFPDPLQQKTDTKCFSKLQ